MITISIARRYARALFDVGLQNNKLEEIGRTLDSFVLAIKQSRDLREAMTNPAVNKETRQAIMGAILAKIGVPDLGSNLLKLLVDRNRVLYAESIAKSFRDLVDQQANRVRARVTSAVPLDDAAVQTIRAQLGQLTGKQVVVERAVDNKLLGGVVAQVGSLTLDGSLATQLEGLRRTLDR